MKFIYLTSHKYPSNKVEPFFIKSMASAFEKLLRDDFTFLTRGKLPYRFRSVSYFFYLPALILKNGWTKREIIFFSSDPYLLAILIFWKKVFFLKYRLVSDWHQLFGDWRDEFVARNSDFLITTSKKLKSLLASRTGADPAKIFVAYGGVDLSLFAQKRTLGKLDYRKILNLPTDDFLTGYVGGFRSVGLEKGIDTMIRSLQLLENGSKMVFVGGSKELIGEYENLAEKLGVLQRCIFVEKQKFEKVIEYDLAMDVLVIPYPDRPHFRDYGFPMKIWEYMAAGRPIIYSNLPIIAEVLGGKAVAFEPDNPNSLADAILSVRDGKFEPAGEPYTWQNRAKNILNFIC